MTTIYATKDAAGAAVQITAGQPFSTAWVKVSDEAEAEAAGVALGDYAQTDINHAASALDAYGPEDLERFDITAIAVADAPEGQRLVSVDLAVSGGVVTATPTYEPLPPPRVPLGVSRMQLKRQLLRMPRTDGQTGNLLDEANAAVAAAGSEDLSLYWTETTDFHRDHPQLVAMATGLGLTSDQVDAAFIAAAQLA